MTKRLNFIGILLGSLLITVNVVYAKGDVEIYGKAHASIDVAYDGANDKTSISNNSTRLNFRGSYDLIMDMKAIWVLESDIDVTGETFGIASRNRYIGLAGLMGKVFIGIYDTPVKKLGRALDIFSETIGDSRAIIGAQSNGENTFDQRAKNAFVYMTPKALGTQFTVLYSTGNSATNSTNDLDNKKDELMGLSLEFERTNFLTGVAYHNSRHENKAGDEGVRFAAQFKSDMGVVGGVYEILNSKSGGAELDRSAYAINSAYNIGLITVIAEYLQANNNEKINYSGASMYAFGIMQSLSKNTRLYAIYAANKNSENAQFSIAAGEHGDQVIPFAVGDDAEALSLGIMHNF